MKAENDNDDDFYIPSIEEGLTNLENATSFLDLLSDEDVKKLLNMTDLPLGL